MTPPLFFLPQLPVGDRLRLDGDEGRHAARVQRLRVGERILVGDGCGTVLTCDITAVDRDVVSASVHARRTEPPRDPRVVVVQALPKGDRGELAVELLTELGADEIVPWAAARSVVNWRDDRGARSLLRWRRTAREAAKQSRQAWMPVVGDLAASAAVETRLSAAALGLVLHESASQSINDITLPATGQLLVVVGPEGGLTDDELTAFGQAGGCAVRLGPSILRTSTAGAAAVASLSVRLGRWN